MEVECGLVCTCTRASRLLAWVLIAALAKLLIPLLLRFQGIERNGVEFFLSWKHNSLEVKPSRTKNQESMRGRIRQRSLFFWNGQTERFRCALEKKKVIFFFYYYYYFFNSKAVEGWSRLMWKLKSSCQKRWK